MATTTQQPPQTKLPMPERAANGGGGGWRNRAPADGNARVLDDFSPPPAGTAIWVAIAAISMSFAAFTSALVVRKGGAPDWRHLTLPPILFANTLVLLTSSVTLHIARRRLSAFMNGVRSAGALGPTLWLQITLGLGFLFVIGQYVAWMQLRAQGLYIATSPNSSFFYVFTTIHALHVLGGLIGLSYILQRFHVGNLRKSTFDAASHYWHFMDVLWLYLLFVLWAKI